MSPQRTRAHELEDESRQAFRALLPTKWVYRTLPDDYGIDGEVEIFTDGHATGLTFKVQLKASDHQSGRVPSRPIKLDWLWYWRSLDVPVLIVYYVAETKVAYGRWAHSVPGNSKRPGVKSLTVAFSEQHRLENAAERLQRETELARELRAGRVAHPFLVTVEVKNSIPGVSGAELRARVRNLVASAHLGHLVQLVATSEHAITVLASPRHLRVALPVDVSTLSLDLPKGYWQSRASSPAPEDILAGIAFVLERVGATQEAAQLYAAVASDTSLTSYPELAEHLVPLLAAHGHFPELIDLVAPLLVADTIEARDLADRYLVDLTNLSKLTSDDEQRLLTAKEARAAIEALSENPRRAGRAHYNLAQHWNAQGDRRRATDEFDLALIHDPGYQDRGYFFRERGGARWDLERYDDAASDYRRALELGADPGEVNPLLADALLYAGRYAEALEALRHHTLGHELDRLAALNELVLNEILRVTNLNRQDRHNATLAQIEAAGDNSAALLDLLKSTDALDPRIWLRLPPSENEPSLPRAVLGALMLLKNSRAWAFATLIAVAEEAPSSLVDHLVDSGMRLSTDDYLDSVESVAATVSPELSEQLRSLVYQRADLNPSRPAPDPIVRVIFDYWTD